MKRFLIAAAIAVTSATIPAFAADVSVSVSIGEPGFYGRIDIGGYPPPQVSIVNRESSYGKWKWKVVRQSICAYRRVTPKIGESTVANTTPAASGSTLCKTTGTPTSMCRITGSSIVTATGMTIMVSKRKIRKTKTKIRKTKAMAATTKKFA